MYIHHVWLRFWLCISAHVYFMARTGLCIAAIEAAVKYSNLRLKAMPFNDRASSGAISPILPSQAKEMSRVFKRRPSRNAFTRPGSRITSLGIATPLQLQPVPEICTAVVDTVIEYLALRFRSKGRSNCITGLRIFFCINRQSKLSQEQLSQLQKDTHFDKKELQQWYKGKWSLSEAY